MKCREIYREENEAVEERYSLSMERISEICEEEMTDKNFEEYFRRTADFICRIRELVSKVENDWLKTAEENALKAENETLYADIMPKAYENSFANPDYAVAKLGEDYGKLLSFVYAEIRGMIVYAFEERKMDITILCELFVQLHTCFQEEMPSYEMLKEIVYWYVSDYCDVKLEQRVRDMLDPEMSFAKDIICEEDLTGTRYLYLFGEYVSESQLKTVRFLNSLPQEEIKELARTFTEGYRKGFEQAGIDLSKKKTVNIRYCLGFERVIREAISQFEGMGLKSTIYRAAVSSVNKRQAMKIGYYGAVANWQYEYDHRADDALYFDKAFVERKLGALRHAYDLCKEQAAVHAGPAVLEVFGETPFAPAAKESVPAFTEKQQKLSVYYQSASGQMINEYIPGDERSFTIMALPVPEVGEPYEKIFEEIVRINTLDSVLYGEIQQKIIDALDQGDTVHIVGKGDNCTDLTVKLWSLKDPSKETVFENCVADVNIPVGEVFTSPVLQGTSGVLHVSEVFLNDLKYVDLKVTLTDGMVSAYSCGNFEDPEEGKTYFLENVMHHHETLPLGEFAIGTNTTAYVMAEKYGIAEKLPILIAEKMGPHFALGDTCYSFSEDQKLFNPDGKEIVAKENSCSVLRKEDPSKAYFNCHTDITIPYKELALIEVLCRDGKRIEIIRDGRFVLPGTEELNKPFEDVTYQ